jgi:hypothetical protein
MELFARAAELGSSQVHSFLGDIHYDKGYLKKAMFHREAATMAGHEVARYILGFNTTLASMSVIQELWSKLSLEACCISCCAKHKLQRILTKGSISRDEIDSTLAAYNSSCVEMRSEARDSLIGLLNDKAKRKTFWHHLTAFLPARFK